MCQHLLDTWRRKLYYFSHILLYKYERKMKIILKQDTINVCKKDESQVLNNIAHVNASHGRGESS